MSPVQEAIGARAGTGLRVRCMECGAEADAAGAVSRCVACGGLLDVVVTTDRRVEPEEFGVGVPAALRSSGVWRYGPLLPTLPEAAIVSRAEGNTPLYRDDRLAAYAGLAPGRLALKHEGHNPTGSFKDRGMTVGISHARAVGARIVACASTGNTSASLASYAAAAGMPALVLIPEGKISSGKLSQTVAYGATVVQVAGDFDQALALLLQLVEVPRGRPSSRGVEKNDSTTPRLLDSSTPRPIYLLNSVNPFRLEGQKTIIFELIEQLGWEAPDVIALPGGNLGNTGAFGKALAELHAVGLIDRLPRLAVIQAAGAAPFADYYAGGYLEFRPVQAETVATAIKIGNPASTARARRAIELTDGVVTTVTDSEIMEAKAAIDRAGVGCEPASAATLAGVRRLVGEGVIAPDAMVAGVLTGHLLKDPDAVIAYHFEGERPRPGANRPIRVPAEMAALERALADALHG